MQQVERESIAALAVLLGQMPQTLKIEGQTLHETRPPAIVADISRLEADLGAKPAIGVEQGLSDAVAWWRDRL